MVQYDPQLSAHMRRSLPKQFVEPQRKVADLIVPRGIENRVALSELGLSLASSLGSGTKCGLKT